MNASNYQVSLGVLSCLMVITTAALPRSRSVGISRLGIQILTLTSYVR